MSAIIWKSLNGWTITIEDENGKIICSNTFKTKKRALAHAFTFNAELVVQS